MKWTQRWRGLAAAGLVPVSLAAVVTRCALSPDFPVVFHGDVSWIAAPVPVTGELQQWGRVDPPLHRFRRTLDARPGAATLSIRAFGDFTARLSEPVDRDQGMGGRVLARSPGPEEAADWRDEVQVELPGASGPRDLVVDVRNARGPALLQARIEGPDGGATILATDTRWQVSVDGGPAADAVVADDTRINPASYASPSPARSLVSERDPLLVAFTLGLGVFAWRRRWERRAPGAPGWTGWPWLAAGLAGLAWAWFGTQFVEIPARVGFDARHHLAYVAFLREHGRVPLATDGWSMFHPPLFYALAALVFGSAGTVGPTPPVVLVRAIPFVSGLATVGVVLGLARRVLPGQPGSQALALGFAALLPMHVYMSANFSGESLHTLLASSALLCATAILLRPPPGPAAAAVLAGLVSLAVLTKFTSLVLVPILLLFSLVRPGASLSKRRAVVWGCVYAGTVAALAGWYYARNWLVLGAPVVANWALPGEGQSWWQWPGFRTPGYYLGFGESLVRPLLSGFHSLGDSVYSTLWGDGYIAGRVNPADRHDVWNYDAMAAGYWLALPTTALLVWGLAGFVVSALRDPDPGRRAVFGVYATTVWAVTLGFFYLSLQVAFYSQMKASYGLLLIGPLAIAFARAAAGWDAALAARDGPGWLALRALVHGWMGSFFGALFLAYAG